MFAASAWLSVMLLVAGPGAGHGRGGRGPEAAQERPTSPPATGLTLTFPASQGRLETGLYFRRGEPISVAAQGSWSMWGGHFGLSNAYGHRFRAGQYGWGCLMARIGSGDVLAVGTRNTWTASCFGTLVLYPNTGPYGVQDGQGELTLQITGGRPVEQVIDELVADDGLKLTLPAEVTEVPTGVYLPAGELVKIDAFGEWRMYPDGPLLTADGDGSRQLPNGQPWGRLMVRTGGQDFAVGEAQYVGQTTELRPKVGGILWLGPNIGDYTGQERSGKLTVVIRGGQPASRELTGRADRTAADYERTLAFLRIHQYRRAMELPDPVCSPELMRAAQQQASLLAAGQASSGTPLERARAAGFKGTDVRECVHGYVAGIKAIDGLWNTVYQRAALVGPERRAVGIGVAKGVRAVCVVMVGAAPGLPEVAGKVPELAAYPPHRGIDLPGSWSGQEKPSPLPSGAAAPLGAPVSVTLTHGKLLKVRRFELKNGRGETIPRELLLLGADPAKLLAESVFLLPQEPLTPQTTYACLAQVETSDGPVRLEWRFTTGRPGALPLAIPDPKSPAGPEVDLGR